MSAEDAVRADVWLWRARFFKTRGLAARFIETGRVRLERGGSQARLDKPARPLRPGDGLTFALGGRIVAVRVLGAGVRRGPAEEARGLYAPIEAAEGLSAAPSGLDSIDFGAERHE